MSLLHVWIGRATGTFSILGSSLIIYMIISDRKRKLVRPYHRLMLLMSFFDVLQSIALVISVRAVPVESNIYGAKGNINTCMTQGFFLMLGLAVPLYNSSLNIYYVLTIRYSISSEKFAKFEPILHAVSILLPLSIATTFTVRNNMAPIMAGWCSTRGKTPLWIVQSVLTFCFIIVTASMICICWTVTSQAMKMQKYTIVGGRRKLSSSRSCVDNEKNETIKQAFLYMLAFVLTYFFVYVGAFYTKGVVGGVPPYAVIILSSAFYPLHGFWNFCFYIRPGVHKVMKKSPEKSCLEAIQDVVFHPECTLRKQRRSFDKTMSSSSSITNVRTVSTPGGTSSLSRVNEISSEETLNAGQLNNFTESYDKPECNNLGRPSTNLPPQSNEAILSESGSISVEDTRHEVKIIILDNDNLPQPKDLENQSKAQCRSGRKKRRSSSLCKIASILDAYEYEDFNNDHYDDD